MATGVSIKLNIPRRDVAFIKQLGKRMGWTISENNVPDSLFDPESGEFLNEETMQAIRDVEAGQAKRCKNLDELLAAL